MDNIKIAFLGDIFLPELSIIPNIDKKLLSKLDNCNFVVANLEGPITEHNNEINKAGPVLKQSNNIIELLKILKVDTVSLANNHIMDHSESGLKDTINVLDKEGIRYGGAGFSEDMTYHPVRLTNNNLCISVLFAAENGFGCFSRPESKSGYAWLFHNKFLGLLHREINESDHVVVVIHCGVEYMDFPLPEWVKIFRGFIDMGVSAVIAHHPHVIQPFEIYNNRPIFYSIGNFYFHKNWKDGRCYYSQVPVINFERENIQVSDVHTVEYDLSRGVSVCQDSEIIGRIEQLNKKYEDGSYINKVNDEVLNLWYTRYIKNYTHAFNAMLNPNTTFKNMRRVLSYLLKRTPLIKPIDAIHNLDIESHRWVVSRAMCNLEEIHRKNDAV